MKNGSRIEHKRNSVSGNAKDEPQTRYTLTLTENQCRVLMDALSLYFRISIGQLREIIYHVKKTQENKIDREIVDREIEHLKMLLFGFWHPGMAYSIMSLELSDCYRVAADIHDVIRHRLSVDDLKPGEKGFGVAYDEVFKKGNEPLPNIQLITTKKDKK